jgi:uncharacterized protein YeaC (DUF1315 family)
VLESILQLEILNWDKFCPRKDLKATTWLRLQNNLLENPDFFDFDHSELMFWVYALSCASKKQTPEVRINVSHAVKIGRFQKETILSAIEKLESLQCVRIVSGVKHADVTHTLRGQHTTNERTDTYADVTERNETARTVARTRSSQVYKFDFESLYANYPKRSGDSKKKTGIEALKKKITSQELFDQALLAVKNYAEHCAIENKTGTGFVKQFSTFFGTDETWREYIAYEPPQAGLGLGTNRAEQRSQNNQNALNTYLSSLEAVPSGS